MPAAGMTLGELDNFEPRNQFDRGLVNPWATYGFNACGIVAGMGGGALFEELGNAANKYGYDPNLGNPAFWSCGNI